MYRRAQRALDRKHPRGGTQKVGLSMGSYSSWWASPTFGITSPPPKSKREWTLIYQLDLFGSTVGMFLIRYANRISEKFAARMEKVFEFYPGGSHNSNPFPIDLQRSSSSTSVIKHLPWDSNESPGSILAIRSVTPQITKEWSLLTYQQPLISNIRVNMA